LRRSPSTVSRELRRNRNRQGYLPESAHRRACQCHAVNARQISKAVWPQVCERLKEQWSPEQISAYVGVSHEAIYRYIDADKRADGTLWKHLQHRKQQRKKRYSSPEKRGVIPNRRLIDERPAIVEARQRIGDWEADTVIGKNHRQAIVTLVERKSGFFLIHKVEYRTIRAVGDAVMALLSPHRHRLHTLTSDNGKEFAGHETISQRLGVDFYFTHPYTAWERGSNESANGLIRQYFPKGRNFTTISPREINTVMQRLNNRPRKRLGFLSPTQVFFAPNGCTSYLNPGLLTNVRSNEPIQ
jgi:IS30 family transposase